MALGWVSPTFPPCCRWSFSGSRWELARGWCPQRLSWGWHKGDSRDVTRDGAGTGGRTSGTSTSMHVLGSQQESPRGRICSSRGMSHHPQQKQGSQPSLPTPHVGPTVRASPKRIPKASPGCPGTPPPYLSPDGLFCREEEEETARVVEDLESAESLLAGRAPSQRAAIGTGRWVQPASAAHQGAGVPALPSPAGPGTHLSFLPSGGDFFEDAVGLRLPLGSLHRRSPKKGEMPSVSLAPASPAVIWRAGPCPPTRTPWPWPSDPRAPPAPRLLAQPPPGWQSPAWGSVSPLAGTSPGWSRQGGPGGWRHESRTC